MVHKPAGFDVGVSVFGSAGVNDKVLSQHRDAVVMGVPTQDGQVSLGILGAVFDQRVTDLAADKKRGPVIVGGLAHVPTRFTKRRNVCGDENFDRGVRQCFEFFLQPLCGKPALLLQHRFPPVWFCVREFSDQRKVIQTDG